MAARQHLHEAVDKQKADKLYTDVDPLRAVLYGIDDSVLQNYLFAKFIYVPLGLLAKDDISFDKLPKQHKQIKQFVYNYVLGTIRKSSFVQVLWLLHTQQFTLLKSYVQPNSKKSVVADRYKMTRLLPTVKASLLKKSTNYYTVGIHPELSSTDTEFKEEEADCGYTAICLHDLQYSQETLRFIYKLSNKIVTNTLSPYIPGLIEYIAYAESNDLLIKNHSFIQYLIGLLFSHITKVNVKVTCEKMNPKSTIITKKCFGIKNQTKFIFDKSVSILLCKYCYSVLNMDFKFRHNYSNKNNNINDKKIVQRKRPIASNTVDKKPVIKKQRTSTGKSTRDSCYSHSEGKKAQSITNINSKPDNLLQTASENVAEEYEDELNQCEDSDKDDDDEVDQQKSIKRNIVSNKIYNDDFNPSILCYCGERHQSYNVIRLLDYNPNGTFYRRTLTWSTNRQTRYKIGISSDCEKILIFHYKRGENSLVKSMPITKSFIDNNNTPKCEQLLNGTGEQLFIREACDLCCLRKTSHEQKTQATD